MIKTKRHGISEGINHRSATKDDIKNTLLKVLGDSSYKINAEKFSARFKDQKEKPLDRAVWWIEWVLRNPDAVYLKSPVLWLGFIAGNSYDVIALITLCVLILFAILIRIISFIAGKIVVQSQNENGFDQKKKQ